MVKNEQTKRQRSIKSKLMAAVCMLLVSCIMMVSSTYAWFTLSTAPEVTGISTAVGANGNLEMALLPKGGTATDTIDSLLRSISSSVGDSTADVAARNITWGNLVELNSNDTYGLNKIVLNPSELNTVDGNTNRVSTTYYLKTPVYGADGRISALNPNALSGTYSNGSFKPDTANYTYGARAVGVASGMTDRQIDYRNARANGNNAVASAINKVISTLTSNGAALADLAIKHGLAEDGNETYTATELQPLVNLIDGLEGTTSTDGVLDYMEDAYLQYILAYAASSAIDGDAVYTSVKAAVEADGATLTSVTAALGTLPAGLQDAINDYNAIVAAVAAARTAMPTITEGATYEWGNFDAALDALMSSSSMTVNGLTVEQVKANKQALVDSYFEQQSLSLLMAPGSGVFADIADQCGDYSASIKLSINYNGLELNNVPATMVTDTAMASPYLTLVGAVSEGKYPAGATDQSMPMSETYGYIIDLAFRTNATNSNLLLQVDPADRIYDDNTYEETMGHGSTMTFKATTQDFSNDQVEGLMEAIRIVFFNPANGDIYVRGKLDATSKEVGANGITMELYLYTTGTSTTTTYVADASGTYQMVSDLTGYTGVKYKLVDGSYVEATDGTVYFTPAPEGYAGDKYKQVNTSTTGETRVTDNKIMALTQNQATAVSVLIYLDGNYVTNANVAATASTSMAGSMNLQFASSAALVPMEYANLHVPGTETGLTYTVTKGEGVTGADTAAANTAYTFTVASGYTLGTVTVGGTALDPQPTAVDGTYTIPAASVTGNIDIPTTTGG